MSLLNSVLGGLLGGGGSSPLQNVLGSLLGGNSNPQGGSYPTGGQGMGGALGGLGGLLSSWQNAGLGQIAQSWVNNGANLPVTPDQLRDVFGHQRVTEMANQAGMDQGSFLNQLSQHLPNAVDGLTPNGRLPDEGTVSV